MKKSVSLVLIGLSIFASAAYAADGGDVCSHENSRRAKLKEKGELRLQKAKQILVDMANRAASAEKDSDKGVMGKLKKFDKLVPQMLADAGECLVVIPREQTVNLPIIPIFDGYRYGAGLEFCRDKQGQMDLDHPTYVQLKGVPLAAFAIGAEGTNLVLSMARDNADKRKLTVRADASASLLKWGRDASVEGDASIKGLAYGVSYSSSKGIYAGVSLDGLTLSKDKAMQAAMEGKPLPKPGLLARIFESSKTRHNDEACTQLENSGTPTPESSSASVASSGLTQSKQTEVATASNSKGSDQAKTPVSAGDADNE